MCLSQQQFSADISPKASSVCLAHLFTYQDFDEGTLGLAYVAPSKPDIAGGLCSKGPINRHPFAAFPAAPVFLLHCRPTFITSLSLPPLTFSLYSSPSPSAADLLFVLGFTSLQLFFVFGSTASPSSSSQQRAMYLNTGLTSTKNYGKTILTKVPGAVCVLVCVLVCTNGVLRELILDCKYTLVATLGTAANCLMLLHSSKIWWPSG